MRKYAISNGMFHMLVILVDTRLPVSHPTPLHFFHLALQVHKKETQVAQVWES